ncbi:MAG: HEAT repeat domain-containing protein [Planctomycetes bacterium]|nr:HEAT repeat domain-containing protein [Planctomycetota bacterium]
MKKTIILTFFVVLSLLCIACEEEEIQIIGKKGTAKPVQKPTKPEKPIASEETPENNSEIDENDNKLPLDDIEVNEQVIENLQKKLIRLNTFDSNVINEVDTYVRNLKKVGLKALIEIINDKESEYRLFAAYMINKVCDKSCIPYLEAIVIAIEEDVLVLENIMMGLASYGRVSSYNTIYEQLHISTSVETRKRIAILLRKISNDNAAGHLIQALKDPNADVRREVIVTLGTFSDPKHGVIEPLVYSMRDEEIEENRYAALEAIIKLNDKANSKYLVEFFQNKENYYEIRCKAIEAIARINDDSFVDELLTQLEDENWHVRIQTLTSLAILHAERAIENMIYIYKNDKIDDVRLRALATIGAFKDERVKKIQIENIKNSNIEYAMNAIFGLCGQDDSEVIPLIFERIDDENPDIRRAVYIAYYRICAALKTKKYIDVIRKRVENENDEVLKKMLKEIAQLLDQNIQTRPQNQESTDENEDESTETKPDSTDKKE